MVYHIGTPFLFYMEKIKVKKLKNGSKLIDVVISGVPYVVISVWLPFGSNQDPVEKQGMAHLLEHLYMSRNRKFKTEVEYLKYLESNSISFNAFTSTEWMVFYFIMPAAAMQSAAKIFLDTFYDPGFGEEDLKKQRQVVLNESLENESDTSNYLFRLMSRAFFKDPAMHKDFYGTEKTLSAIMLKDIKEYRKKMFTDSNVSFMVISPNGVPAETERIFAAHSFDSGSALERPVPEFASKDVVQYKKQDNTSARMVCRFPSLGDVPGMAIGNFIRDYLGNSWSSALISELRINKGIVYWVDTHTEYFPEYGFLSIGFSCENKDLPTVKKEIGLALARLSRVLLKPGMVKHFTEMYVFKTQCKQADPLHNLYWFGTDIVFGNPAVTHEAYYKAARAITPRAVRNFAKKYLQPEHMAWITINNKK